MQLGKAMLDDFNIFPPGVCFLQLGPEKFRLKCELPRFSAKGALQICSWMSFIGSGPPLRRQDSRHLSPGEKTCDWQSYSDLVPDLMVPPSCVFMCCAVGSIHSQYSDLQQFLKCQ